MIKKTDLSIGSIIILAAIAILAIFGYSLTDFTGFYKCEPVTASLIGGGLMLLGEGAKWLGGRSQQKRAQKELDKLLKTPRPTFETTPELSSYYQQALEESRRPQGFTPQEQTAWEQNQAKLMATQYRNAANIGGGNLSRTISGMNLGGGLMAGNQFAQQDAALRRQARFAALNRVGQGMGRIQGLRTMQNQADLSYRNQLEQNLGLAMQHGRQNQMDVFGTIGNWGGYILGSGLGGGGGTGGARGINYPDYSVPNMTQGSDIYGGMPSRQSFRLGGLSNVGVNPWE